MLKRLNASGFNLKVGTILGDIFNYSDKKSQATTINSTATMFNEESDSKKHKAEEFGICRQFAFAHFILNI